MSFSSTRGCLTLRTSGLRNYRLCVLFKMRKRRRSRRRHGSMENGRRRSFGLSAQGRVNYPYLRIMMIDDRGFMAAEKMLHTIGHWKGNHHSENFMSSDKITRVAQCPLQKKTRAPDNALGVFSLIMRERLSNA